MKDNFLVWSEHSALGDEVAEERSDLSSCASDGNSNRVGLKIKRRMREVSSESLNSRNEDRFVHFSTWFCKE